MGAAAIYVLITAAQDMGATFGLRPLHAPLLQAILLAALAVAGAIALPRPDPALMGLGRTDAQALADPALPDASAFNPADRATLARLNRAMDEEEVWRREDLSIRALADHVNSPSIACAA